MHFESRSHWSGELGREMYFNVYGHAGKPIIVFPSSGGNQNEYLPPEECLWPFLFL